MIKVVLNCQILIPKRLQVVLKKLDIIKFLSLTYIGQMFVFEQIFKFGKSRFKLIVEIFKFLALLF